LETTAHTSSGGAAILSETRTTLMGAQP
jgi:hypothetical protein